MITITVPSVALTYDKSLLRKVLRQAGMEIAATARALIGRMAAGKRYSTHIASAPGQPPMTLSGALARSLKVKVRGDRVQVTDAMFYSKFLETGAVGGGGKRGSKNLNRSHKKGAGPGKTQTRRVMAPRPFLSTAREEEMPSLEKRIQAALSAGVDLKILKGQR